MHTIGAADATFEISVDGHTATLDDLMPGLTATDRMALVVRSSLGGVGASALILSMVLDFYAAHADDVQALAPGEILYPEHHVVHVGAARGDYAWLDFWPPQKETVVPADRAAVVRRLVDLGITRLLIEEVGAPHRATDDAVLSADERRLEAKLITAVAFSATGRCAPADVRIASNAAVEQWVGWTIDPERAAEESDRPSARSSDRLLRAHEVADDERVAARAARAAIVENSLPVETYRRVTARQAISLLS